MSCKAFITASMSCSDSVPPAQRCNFCREVSYTLIFKIGNTDYTVTVSSDSTLSGSDLAKGDGKDIKAVPMLMRTIGQV